jgi:hypothetical protein
MAKSKKKNYIKVIDEQFIVPHKQGGGIIKFEAWEYENKIVNTIWLISIKIYFQMIMEGL